MPTVPTYDGPRVQRQALQPVFQGAPDVSSGVQTAARVASGFADMADRTVRRDAEAEANQIDTEVTTAWLEWDAQARKQYRGTNVGDYEAEAKKWWDDAAAKYADKVSPLARQAVGPALGRKRTQALGSVLQYAGAERERHADEASAAAVQTTIEFGIDTGNTAGAALDVRRKIAEQGARKGWTTEQVQAEQQRALGTMHLAYVTRLAQSDPTKATAYFEANKGEIPMTAQVKVEEVLKGERDNQAARQFAATVANRPLSEQLAEAGKLTDPGVREKALTEVRNNHAMVQAAARERQQAASDQAWQLAAQFKRIPEAVLSSMDGKEREQLREHLRLRSERIAKGAAPASIKTDWNTYETVRERIARGENVRVAAFAERIAPSELEKLIDLKTKRDDPKKAAEVATTLQLIGAATKNLEASARGAFELAVFDELNRLEAKGPVPYEQKRQLIDRMLIDGEVLSGSMFSNDPNMKYYQANPEQRKRFAPFISKADSDMIEAALVREGIKSPTTQQIMDRYKLAKGLQ